MGGGRGGRSGKSIDYLLIFVSEWTGGDWCAHVTSVCVSVCVCQKSACVRAYVRVCVKCVWCVSV